MLRLSECVLGNHGIAGGPGSSQSSESPQALLWSWRPGAGSGRGCLSSTVCSVKVAVQATLSRRALKQNRTRCVLWSHQAQADGQETAVPPAAQGAREERTASSRGSLKELCWLWAVGCADAEAMAQRSVSPGEGVCGPDLWVPPPSVWRVALSSWCSCGLRQAEQSPHCKQHRSSKNCLKFA